MFSSWFVTVFCLSSWTSYKQYRELNSVALGHLLVCRRIQPISIHGSALLLLSLSSPPYAGLPNKISRGLFCLPPPPHTQRSRSYHKINPLNSAVLGIQCCFNSPECCVAHLRSTGLLSRALDIRSCIVICSVFCAVSGFVSPHSGFVALRLVLFICIANASVDADALSNVTGLIVNCRLKRYWRKNRST